MEQKYLATLTFGCPVYNVYHNEWHIKLVNRGWEPHYRDSDGRVGWYTREVVDKNYYTAQNYIEFDTRWLLGIRTVPICKSCHDMAFTFHISKVRE